jgi:hypothetical protein
MTKREDFFSKFAEIIISSTTQLLKYLLTLFVCVGASAMTGASHAIKILPVPYAKVVDSLAAPLSSSLEPSSLPLPLSSLSKSSFEFVESAAVPKLS